MFITAQSGWWLEMQTLLCPHVCISIRIHWPLGTRGWDRWSHLTNWNSPTTSWMTKDMYVQSITMGSLSFKIFSGNEISCFIHYHNCFVMYILCDSPTDRRIKYPWLLGCKIISDKNLPGSDTVSYISLSDFTHVKLISCFITHVHITKFITIELIDHMPNGLSWHL